MYVPKNPVSGDVPKFILEVYGPESIREALFTLHSNQPFPPIAVGDIIDPYSIPDRGGIAGVLRVVRVEHMFMMGYREPGYEASHQLRIFCEELTTSQSAAPASHPQPAKRLDG